MAAGTARVKLVVFDLAGTTVNDSIDGLPLVTVAMKEAFTKHGFDVPPTVVNKYRGLEKREAIRRIARDMHSPTRGADATNINTEKENGNSIDGMVDTLFCDFKTALNNHLYTVDKEIPGTTKIFQTLKSHNIKVAVGSGFPHNVVENLVTRLGWKHLVDYVTSAEKEGHGRPHPAMIQAAMKSCGVVESCQVVKVGDSKVDIEEGKNANCWTVAVLTGTQSEESLREVKPDFVLASVDNLMDVLQDIADKT